MRPKLLVAAALALALIGTSAAHATEIFVPNNNDSVAVHDTASSGNTLPLRLISGPATGVGLTFSTAVDSNRGELYVSNFIAGTITVFPLDADGDVAPLRTIDGPATRLDSPIGLAYDPIHDELFVRLFGGTEILVFAGGADGDVAPLRSIDGPATRILPNTSGIALDLVHDELVVASRDTSGTDSAILVFPRDAQGDVAPIRSIQGSELAAHRPYGIFVDTANGEYIATLIGSGGVAVYPGTADGTDVAPIRHLTGTNTLLNSPTGVYVDHGDDLLILAIQSSPGRLHIFDRTATGNTAPLRSIEGSETGLVSPSLLSGPHRLIFRDGFESGDLSLWSQAAP